MKIYYVNTHLDHVEAVVRKEGLAMVVRNVSSMNPHNYPVILTGDFNAFPDDPYLEPLDKIMSCFPHFFSSLTKTCPTTA